MEPAKTKDVINGEEEKHMKKGVQYVPFYKLYMFAEPLDMLLIVLGTVGALVAGSQLPLAAYIFGNSLDALAWNDPHKQQDRMIHTSLFALYAGFIAAVGYFFQVLCWTTLGERQADRIRFLYLKALLRQDLSFYDQEVTTGTVVECMTADMFSIKQATGEKVGRLVQILGNLLSGYGIALSQGWKLSLLVTAIMPLIVISGYTMDTTITRTTRKVFQANGNAGNVVEQVITAIRTVVAFGCEKKAIQAYNEALKTADRASLQEGVASGVGMGFIIFFTNALYSLILWYGAILIVHGTYTGGRVITVLFSIMIATGALAQCTPNVSSIAAGTAAAHKMFQVIFRVPGVDIADESGQVLDVLKGDIQFRNVRFAYPTRPEYLVFTDFSLSVPAGTTAALVGESGSGKSTVVSLIERFYDPLAGEVLIDGINLKKLKLSWFRSQIGLVSQEPVLLRGSILDNLTYGRNGASDDEVQAAVQMANAAKFIGTLPDGMHTVVGQGGMQLSGGQKQRIAIARAVLKDPRILLLDEATSSLDAESESVVHEALDKVMKGRTTIIIAHRLTTVKNADFIAVLQYGHIIEQGPHAELLSKSDGVFSQLVNLEDRIKDQQQTPHQPESERWPSNASSITGVTNAKMIGSGGPSSGALSVGSLGSIGSIDIDTEAERQLRGWRGLGGDGEEHGSVRWSHFIRLAAYNKPEAPFLFLGSLAAGTNGAVLPIVGLLFANIIRTFYEPPNIVRKDSLLWICMFIVIAVLSLLAIPLQNIFFTIAGEKLVRRIRLLTFDKILHQEIAWFDGSENASGLISSRLLRDASYMRTMVGDALALIVQNLTTVVVGVFIAVSTCWQLALLFIALLPFYGMDGLMQIKLGELFDAKAKVMYEETSQIAHEALSSIRTVASFCAEKKVLNVYRLKSMDCVKSGMRRGLLGGVVLAAAYVVIFGSMALSFWVGGLLVMNKKVSFDGFVKTFLAIELSAFAISVSVAIAPDMSNVKPAVISIFSMLDLNYKDVTSGTKLKRLKGEVEFQNVHFMYPSRPDAVIFSDLSFTLQAGKTLALVGESGCGKSTALALVQRFYDPHEGCILLDKIDITQLQVKWLRRQMGLVSQEPFLFNDTIRANIRYGMEGEVSEEAVRKAAEVANADKFIAGLPNGYESVVGERGVQLSGGQKQRVAIARAMVRDPKIVLLDEATSALDAESEVVVEEALQQAAKGRSTMVVAHRLSTVRNAHLIVVLKNGCVAEQGTHSELMALKHGLYATLVRISTSNTDATF